MGPVVDMKPQGDNWRSSKTLPPAIERLEKLLDDLVRVGPFRVGLDGLVGLFPGGGDWITALAGSVIIISGAWQGLPKVTLFRMVINLATDMLLGAIPFIGDLFDFVYKSNRMNLRLYREALAGTRNLRRDWLFFWFIVVLLLAICAIPVLLLIALWRAIPNIRLF